MLLVAGYFLAMVVVHELGHIVTIRAVSDAHLRVSVWPGYELYPLPGADFQGRWPESGVMVVEPYFRRDLPVDLSPVRFPTPADASGFEVLHRHNGLIMLMGSGATWAVSLLCLAVLTARKHATSLVPLLTAGGLLHLDMLTYTVFPLFLDAPHLYFFGGSKPEPILGLVEMGLTQDLAVGLVMLGSAVQLGWLYWLRKRQRRGDLVDPRAAG